MAGMDCHGRHGLPWLAWVGLGPRPGMAVNMLAHEEEGRGAGLRRAGATGLARRAHLAQKRRPGSALSGQPCLSLWSHLCLSVITSFLVPSSDFYFLPLLVLVTQGGVLRLCFGVKLVAPSAFSLRGSV